MSVLTTTEKRLRPLQPWLCELLLLVLLMLIKLLLPRVKILPLLLLRPLLVLFSLFLLVPRWTASAVTPSAIVASMRSISPAVFTDATSLAIVECRFVISVQSMVAVLPLLSFFECIFDPRKRLSKIC